MENTKVKKILHTILSDICIPIAIGVVIAFIFGHFFGKGVIHGDSMNPTLKDGQNVFIFKTNRDIKEEDIVFIHSDYLGEDIVKRVVALEGDKVRIENGDVYVNDKKIDDSYTNPHNAKQCIDEIEVPKDYIYVLGDNRDNSTDSRILGPISIGDVFAKVIWH